MNAKVTVGVAVMAGLVTMPSLVWSAGVNGSPRLAPPACDADWDDDHVCLNVGLDEVIPFIVSILCPAAAAGPLCDWFADRAVDQVGETEMFWVNFEISTRRVTLGVGDAPSSPPVAVAAGGATPVDFHQALLLIDTYLDAADLPDGSGTSAAWTMLSVADQAHYACGGIEQFARFWESVYYVDPQASWRLVSVDPDTGWLTIDADLRYVYHDGHEEVDDARFVVGRRPDGQIEIVDYDPDRDEAEVAACGA